MKKTIFFAILTAAFILLSGCDAMLEVFYPEYADNYDNNNVLTVEYDLSKLSSQEIVDLDLNHNPIKVEIFIKGKSPVSDLPVASIDVYGEVSYWFDFYVTSGSYDVWIWQDGDGDGDGDGILDNGEFVLKEDKSTPPNFTFYDDSGEYHYYCGDEWATF